MILAPYSLIFQNPITKWSSYRDYKHYKVYPRPFAPSSPMLLSQPIVRWSFSSDDSLYRPNPILFAPC